jgi:hypothetical protein
MNINFGDDLKEGVSLQKGLMLMSSHLVVRRNQASKFGFFVKLGNS